MYDKKPLSVLHTLKELNRKQQMGSEFRITQGDQGFYNQQAKL